MAQKPKTTLKKSQPKKTEESSLNIFLIGLIVVIPFAAQYLYQLHQVVTFRLNERPDVDQPEYHHFYITAKWTIFMVVMRYLFGFYVFRYLGERVISAKYTGEERRAKVHRFGHLLFKFCFFVTISIYGFIVLHDKEYVPWVLGGSGDIRKAFPEGFPFVPMDKDVAYYYLWGLSYHVMSLIYHLAMPKKHDFLEMLLHHIVTIFLVFFSYMSGYLRFGSLVFFLHDATDVFSYLMKSSIDTQSVALNLTNYALLLIAWGIGRLYIFPVYLIYETFYSPSLANLGDTVHGLYFFYTMLIILYFLHCYWYTMFIKMGRAYATRGAIRDAQVDGFDEKESKN